MDGYWERLASRRPRRRTLLATSAVGLGSLALATSVGCGSGGEGESKPKGEFSLYKPEDTSKQAVAGGTYKTSTTGDLIDKDPLVARAGTSQTTAGWVYNRLLKFETGYLKPATGAVEGDLAESWEVADQGTRIVLKLRRDAKFDPRGPTNSRAVDASDVAFSWDRFSKLHSDRQGMIYAANPNAGFDTISTPDNYTVVFKLAFPWAPSLAMLASPQHFYVLPKESDGGFDPKSETRGSGAWLIDQHQTSTLIVFKKNPNWFRKDRPFIDTVEMPVVPEYATRLAEFRAGNIWDGVVQIKDIISTKRDLPGNLLTEGGNFSTSVSGLTAFGFAPGSPYVDDRVRKAVSMAYDRQLWVDTFFDPRSFQAVGVDMDTPLGNFVPPVWTGYWFDPTSKQMGDAAQYFHYNVAEAKKLLSAAGYANGLDSECFFNGTGNYGTEYANAVEVQMGMLRDVGIRNKMTPLVYQTEYLPRVSYSNGQYNGLSIQTRGFLPEIGPLLFSYYIDADALSLPKRFDPTLNDYADRQMKELDPKKRTEIIQDMFRYMGSKMYVVPRVASIKGFDLVNPAVRNLGVYLRWLGGAGAPQETLIHNWIDKTKLKS